MTDAKKEIDAIRTKAWVREVTLSRSPKGTSLTPTELTKLDWLDFKGEDHSIRFDRFATGLTVPSINTVDLVDECLECESDQARKGKRTVNADLFPCGNFFKTGPENAPLWQLLGEECPESVCMPEIDFFLFPKEKGMEVKQASFTAKPFSDKVDMAWRYLVGDAPVDFDGYDSGEQGNAVVRKVKAGLLKPNLLDINMILALRHVSERRKERRSETRYLFDALLSMLGVLDEWGIREDIERLLRPWQAPTNPVTIAFIDERISKTSPKLGDISTTPAGSGVVFGMFIEALSAVRRNS